MEARDDDEFDRDREEVIARTVLILRTWMRKGKGEVK